MGIDLSWITAIFPQIIDGGSGVIFLLLLALFWLIREYWKLQAAISKQDDRIEKIMTDYHNAVISSTDALHRVEMVLNEIRWRCSK
jgi:hypothetical protein